MFMSLALMMFAITASDSLRVVPEVDFTRYAGRWYEIARLPNWFERRCASDVTADYSLREDGKITVVNRCREENGDWKEATGVARRVSGRPPSVLQVRFAPAFLSVLPLVWGDYQIMELAPDYSHAVVGTPDRSYLWILSRTPKLDRPVYESLVEAARSQGFDTSRLVMPRHGG